MIATSKINLNNPLHPLFSPAPRPADASPLLAIGTLMGLSRRRFTQPEILRLIDRREIGWAWDIGRRMANQPEIRIWGESLFAFLARDGGSTPVSLEKFTLAQVIGRILPPPATPFSPRTALIRRVELQRRLLCSGTHLGRLIGDGELAVEAGSRQRKKTSILYQSAVEFLHRRTMSL